MLVTMKACLSMCCIVMRTLIDIAGLVVAVALY
jgi:hypothetical protein